VKPILLLAAVIAMCLSASAQSNSQTPMAPDRWLKHRSFRVLVTSRTTEAVNYKHRSGATKSRFRGNRSDAVGGRQSRSEQQAGCARDRSRIRQPGKPTTFGTEYLTYILWAISPEGRAVNLGEVLVGDSGHTKLKVTTDLQAFALIVTAEPYYAVRQPSNVVVLENIVRSRHPRNHRGGKRKVRTHGARRLYSDRLQVRSRGSERQVAPGIL
jgi:hypothetical protein